MVWVRIDDRFDENPKVAQLSDSAVALFVAGLTYSGRNLTDGFIPHNVGMGQLRWCEGNAIPAIRELEGVGLWHPSGESCSRCVERMGGWQVHDYHDYQPARDDVLREREAAKERKRKSREKSQHTSRRDAGRTSGTVTPPPVPVPGPVTEVLEGQDLPSTGVDSESSYEPGFLEFWEAYPRRNGKKVGKQNAAIEWRRLSGAERDRATIGARHLAASDTLPKDPERFLRRAKGGRGGFPFDDWQTPATPTNGRKPRQDAKAAQYGPNAK